MNKLPLLFLFLMLLLNSLFSQQVSLVAYTETIKTYPFSDPDPLPIIDRYNEIYPYFRFDGFSHEGKPEDWRMVKLENEHIMVYVLPDMGGKVWGAIDKKTGKEFIYKNDVVKFRDVAQRGAWTSGGIEFNTGVIGHHPATATPVDYTLFTDAEGTAHCVVGATDLSAGIEWRVDISLSPGKAWFETRTFWFNHSPFHQANYYWSNAAVKSADDLHFYFPGTHWLGHDGRAHPWPVDEQGIDRSWYKNNRDNGSSSYHVLGSTDNYYVSFFHDEQFGSAHWSPVWGTPGKKIWLWAQSRSGAIWEKLLTDAHGQYVEVQAGRMFNQNSFSSAYTPFKQTSFQPLDADSWRERWFPLSGMSGISRVVENGALFLDFSGQGLQLQFYPAEKIEGLLRISQNGKMLAEEGLTLAPAQTLHKHYPQITASDGLLVSLDGKTLYQQGADYRMSRPLEAPPAAFEDALIRGREYLFRRDYAHAQAAFEAHLQANPHSLEALAYLAELHHFAGRTDEALAYCRQALGLHAYDAHANFVFAQLSKGLGHTADAEDGFRFAMREPAYRSPSLTLMAEMRLAAGDYEEAAGLADEALRYQAANLKALQLKAMAYRKAGMQPQARQAIDALLEVDPLSHFAHFEQYLLSGKEEDKALFVRSFNNEMAKETYLDMAIDYVDAGLQQEAMEVLKLSPPNPIAHYWLAWLSGEEQALDEALSASPFLIFPFRTQTLQPLKWSTGIRKSWKTDYYQALILWNKGRKEEALALLQAWEFEPDFAPFYYARASLKGMTSDEALEDLFLALTVDPTQWRLYRELSGVHQQRKEYDKALEITRLAHDRFPGNFILDIRYAQSLSLVGQYEASLAVLEQIDVLPFEGENSAQNVYVQDHLMLAVEAIQKKKYRKALQHLRQSELYPENLGSGSPSYPDYRAQQYLRACIYEQQGKTELAAKEYEQLMGYQHPYRQGPGSPVNRLAYLLALYQSGNTTQAAKLAAEWAEEHDSLFGRWAKALIGEDAQTLSRLAQDLPQEVASPNEWMQLRVLMALSACFR